MKLFSTQRERVLELFKAANKPFVANTKPYQSTRTLFFRVTNVNDTAGRTYAYAVADAGQTLEFFAYGVGETWVQFPNVGINGPVATEAETNLGKAKSTNGAQDFVIEGVGFHCRGLTQRLPQSAGEVPVGGTLFAAADYFEAAQTPDPIVLNSFAGLSAIADPGGLASPPQLFSPFNLEQAMMQAVIGYMSLEFEWDRVRTEKITVTDLLPQAGAASYLRANGEPCSSNRWRIPEGYIWRRDGQGDSEFIARVILRKPIVIPIDIPQTPANNAAFVTPSLIGLELVMRLYGLSCALPSAN